MAFCFQKHWCHNFAKIFVFENIVDYSESCETYHLHGFLFLFGRKFSTFTSCFVVFLLMEIFFCLNCVHIEVPAVFQFNFFIFFLETTDFTGASLLLSDRKYQGRKQVTETKVQSFTRLSHQEIVPLFTFFQFKYLPYCM